MAYATDEVMMPAGLTRFLFLLHAALLALLGMVSAQAQPSQVVVGTYVNKIQAIDFRNNTYAIDFYLWFRWKAEGGLEHYKPLESFEIINGKVENRSSVVEKTIGDVHYAAVRVNATMAETWKLAKFPFDSHTMRINVEDSVFTANDLVFVADTTNSALGDELNMSGWKASNFGTAIDSKTYRTNYGDLSLPTDALSEYSRFAFILDIERQGYGAAFKLLNILLLATAVAFLAFMVKPSDLDARFGMGVGALFAAAASAIIAASDVPESGVTTMADFTHSVALAVIFATLLVSTLCLKLEVSGHKKLAYRIDRICLVVFPLLFYGWVAWAVWAALR
ncbi:MAG: hypothetical protein ACRC2B_20165 [Rubrivivax sp.]